MAEDEEVVDAGAEELRLSQIEENAANWDRDMVGHGGDLSHTESAQYGVTNDTATQNSDQRTTT